MSVVSARAFTVEETQKYAAAINDPLRMATNLPGVASLDDGMNQIVIAAIHQRVYCGEWKALIFPTPIILQQKEAAVVAFLF
jgi:hypothetical protein